MKVWLINCLKLPKACYISKFRWPGKVFQHCTSTALKSRDQSAERSNWEDWGDSTSTTEKQGKGLESLTDKTGWILQSKEQRELEPGIAQLSVPEHSHLVLTLSSSLTAGKEEIPWILTH